MTEAAFQARCLKKARDRGWLAYKWISTVRGVPDCIFITTTGAVRFVEFKNPSGKGRLSQMQVYIHAKFKENNSRVFVISTPDEFDAFLEAEC